MPRIIVLGGGICGLAAGLMLARDGHDVTLLERDAEPAPGRPDEAWECWERRGVAQFRQPHYVQPRARRVLDAELPDVARCARRRRRARFDPLATIPPMITDRAARPGDDRFVTLTARRPPLERSSRAPRRRARPRGPPRHRRRRRCPSAADGAARRRRADRRRRGDPRRPRGRRDGPRLEAAGLLAAAGAEPMHEEAADSGFIYYTRFFRGTQPEPRAPPLNADRFISILTLPATPAPGR